MLKRFSICCAKRARSCAQKLPQRLPSQSNNETAIEVVMILAMTGKGGVGKTTLSAMVINWLVSRGETPILAVDADSNANLHEALGVGLGATVGGIREDAREQAKSLKGVSKQEFLELRVQESLVECDGYEDRKST